jgi:hypothetical protein
MTGDDFERYVSKVAEKTMQQGGTASKPMTRTFLPVMDVWSFPKYPSRTAILPPAVNLALELEKFISRNEMLLDEEDCWLGTWIHPRTGEYYLDVATGITDLEEARRAAMKASADDGRNIVALFNSKRNETFFLWDK